MINKIVLYLQRGLHQQKPDAPEMSGNNNLSTFHIFFIADFFSYYKGESPVQLVSWKFLAITFETHKLILTNL